MNGPRLPSPRLPAVLLAVILAGGCSDLGPGDELLQYLENARTRWGAVRPQRYEYGLYRVCDCTAEMSGPVTVSVQGLTPVARTYEGGGAVPDSLQTLFPSVDGLLDMIEEAIRGGAWDVTVQYDPETGVPVEFRIDYEPLVFDEEASYRVVAMPRTPGA